MIHPVIIIGAGPAGLAAALQLTRSGIKPLILEKDRVGGLLLNAYRVENYLGFLESISGPGLVHCFERQIRRWGIKISEQEVVNLTSNKSSFRIVTNKGILYAHTVIMASGTSPYPAGIKGEVQLVKQGRLYYEIRNLPAIKTRDSITILGSGDAAFDYALNLASRVRLINIIIRSEQHKCIRLLFQRVKNNKRIKLFTATHLLSAEETSDKKYLLLSIKKGNKVGFVKTDYLLVATGRDPEVRYWTGPTTQAEHIPGLFLAGDVKRDIYRQASIAIGDGILAAMQVIKYLKS